MTDEQIIEMARRAGAVFPADGSYHSFERLDDLEAFAKLVAQHEREACAKIAEEPWQGSPKAIAELIRARGEA